MIQPTTNAARWYALAERYFQARDLPIEEMRVIDCWPVEGLTRAQRATQTETQAGVYYNGRAWEYYRGHPMGTPPRPQDLCAIEGTGFYRVTEIPYTEDEILASDGYLEQRYSARRLGPAEHTTHFHKVIEHKREHDKTAEASMNCAAGDRVYRPARVVYEEFFLECIVCGFKDRYAHASVLRAPQFQDHMLALAPSDCCAPKFLEYDRTSILHVYPHNGRVVQIELDGVPKVFFDEDSTREITRALRHVPILNCFDGVFDEYPHKHGFKRRDDF